MTSKNLYSKLMKEDAKRRLWLISLLMLVFVFLYPVAVTMILGERAHDSNNGLTQAETIQKIMEMLIRYFSNSNGAIVVILTISAVVCGISSFSFLYSKKKVDFYHSIPVKRETMFLANYLNGIIMMAAVFFVNLAMANLIILINGMQSAMILTMAAKTFVILMGYFVLLYSVVVLAVMLTGNTIIGLLGTSVFFLYGPAVALLLEGFMQMWFRTYYYSTDMNILYKFMMHSSPMVYYIWKLPDIFHNHMAVMLWGILAAAIITALALWLYKKRPSEAAGKAMAFEQSKAPIKIFLVIPVSLAGCILFWGIRNSMAWALFGLIVMGAVMHCLMEIIYSFDFRQLFANKLHLIVCLLAAIFVFLGFKYDIVGYDKYIPAAEKVEYSSISVGSLDHWITYGEAQPIGSGMEEADLYYTWNYEDADEFIFRQMKIKDMDTILSIAEKGIKRDQGIKQEGIDTLDYTGTFHSVNIRYHLKNGRDVYRSYYLPLPAFEQEIGRIYQTPEYKMGVFPIMTQTAEETVSVYYQELNDISQVASIDSGNNGRLLDAYKKDLGEMTLEMRYREAPIGMIQFRTNTMHRAIISKYNDSWIAQRTYYPIYPSFEHTINLLKSEGIEPGAKIRPETVQKIVLHDSYIDDDTYDTYDGNYYKETQRADEAYGSKVYEFTDADDIAAMLECMVPYDYADLNQLYPVDNYLTAEVFGNNKKIYRYAINTSKIPDSLKERIGYMEREN